MIARFVRRWGVALALAVAVVAAWVFVVPGPAGEGGHSHGAAAACTGSATIHYACHQQRYRDLVLESGWNAPSPSCAPTSSTARPSGTPATTSPM